MRYFYQAESSFEGPFANHFLRYLLALMRSLFSIELFCLSTSPFACGHYGGVEYNVIPCSLQKHLNSLLINCRPLSAVIVLSSPRREKNFRSCSVVSLEVIFYGDHFLESTIIVNDY